MEFAECAVSAARESWRKIKGINAASYTKKNDYDILSQADLISEQTIIQIIESHFPTHSVLSEEKGDSIRQPDYLWIIDPLDGTINFSRRIEEFAISIALEHRGELILGVIYHPLLEKMYVAQRGQGSFLNGERIVVSGEAKLSDCILATDNSSKIETRRANFALLSKLCDRIRHARIFGAGALHLARLAEGNIDSYYKTRVNYWDYAAGVLLIEEAGGKVTDWQGRKLNRDSRNILATNGLLHQELLDLIDQFDNK